MISAVWRWIASRGHVPGAQSMNCRVAGGSHVSPGFSRVSRASTVLEVAQAVVRARRGRADRSRHVMCSSSRNGPRTEPSSRHDAPRMRALRVVGSRFVRGLLVRVDSYEAHRVCFRRRHGARIARRPPRCWLLSRRMRATWISRLVSGFGRDRRGYEEKGAGLQFGESHWGVVVGSRPWARSGRRSDRVASLVVDTDSLSCRSG